MPNWWERKHALNPRKANARRNPDHDGLRNLGEYQLGGDPRAPDTDSDGLRDGDEVTFFGTSVSVRDALVGQVSGAAICGQDGTACGIRPLAGVELSALNADGYEVARTISAGNGRFSFRLTPGSYTLIPHPVSGFKAPPPAMPITVEIKALRKIIAYEEAIGQGVVGQALLWPTCPVQREGEDCTQPAGGAIVEVTDAGGRVIASQTAGPGGRYAFRLSPGSYILRGRPITEGPLPLPPDPVPFTILPSDAGPRQINLDYDTGIR